MQVDSIEFLILDEVHCMNERGGGDVWERLMLSVR
jgi:superfamily II RNA helicase